MRVEPTLLQVFFFFFKDPINNFDIDGTAINERRILSKPKIWRVYERNHKEIG